MNRLEKQNMIEELNGYFSASESLVLVRQDSLTVAESNAMRSECRALGVGYKVVKNRLAKIAIKGTKYEGLADSFTGVTGIAFSEDNLASTKAIVKCVKSNDKISVLVGGMGDKCLTREEVIEWGSLPSLDELRGKIVGLISAPATKVALVAKAYGESE